MKFKMPVINELSTRIKKLDTDYMEMDNTRHTQGFFISSPQTTTFKPRHEDIYFIQNIAKDVVDIRFEYDNIDKSFKGKDYASITAPFLKNAISGAAILVLTHINNTCTREADVKDNSVLASRIMDIYEINKLSDISPKKQLECFEALKQYITIKDQKTWHAEKSNHTLIEELDTAIRNVSAHQNIFGSRVS